MANPTGYTRKGAGGVWKGRRPFALATQTLIVFRGRVQRAKLGKASLVKTKTATIRVWWAGGVLPPNIYEGQKVRVVGKIVTYDDGRDWRVSDALILTESWKTVMEPVFERLWMFCLDPAEYCPKDVIDMYRFRRPLDRAPY